MSTTVMDQHAVRFLEPSILDDAAKAFLQRG
jgi:hypothetical protein